MPTALVHSGKGPDVPCDVAEESPFALYAYTNVPSLHMVGLSSLCACEHGKADLAEHCDDGAVSEVDADLYPVV